MSDITLSVIVSVYNEEEVLNIFHNELKKILDDLNIKYEILFINDGSDDKSLKILSDIVSQDDHIKIINFSRNFGHEAAMTAGIDNSSGDVVVCMDADLQHPPFKIKEMLGKFLEGYEIVLMTRIDNKGANFFNIMTSKLFYKFLNVISPEEFVQNASDFFLISKRVVHILKNEFRERTRFLRGFIQIIGFKKTTIEFVAPKRAGGVSKYSFSRLFKLTIGAMLTFSNLPLRLGGMAGVVTGLFGIIVGIYSIIMKIDGYAPPGYTTIVVLISFLFSIQFFIIGIIGEYLGVLTLENKKRPIYIIDNIVSYQK